MFYSLSSLSVIMLVTRTYYSRFSELKPVIYTFHELVITASGIITIFNILTHTKPIETIPEIIGSVFFSNGIYLMHLTHKEMKSSFSPRVDIDLNRKLINTGIFSKIRHPMYLSNFIMMIGVLLMSKNGWIVFFNSIFSASLLFRIPFEEDTLIKQFPNYIETMPKYRIIPLIY